MDNILNFKIVPPKGEGCDLFPFCDLRMEYSEFPEVFTVPIANLPSDKTILNKFLSRPFVDKFFSGTQLPILLSNKLATSFRIKADYASSRRPSYAKSFH